jgi:hypothetical protein
MLPRRRNGPLVCHSDANWRRTLHRTSRSSTKIRSPEILTSTSTGAHIKPLDPVLDKPIDPELCSLHAASSSHRTAAEIFSLQASCLFALLGRIVTCTAAGPGSPPTGVPRPDDPIVATSRWGRLAYQSPHCSPMGISWGSSPQGSPLTNHPSWRRRAQVTHIPVYPLYCFLIYFKDGKCISYTIYTLLKI